MGLILHQFISKNENQSQYYLDYKKTSFFIENNAKTRFEIVKMFLHTFFKAVYIKQNRGKRLFPDFRTCAFHNEQSTI